MSKLVNATLRFDPELHKAIRRTVVERDLRSFQRAAVEAFEIWLRKGERRPEIAVNDKLKARIDAAARSHRKSVEDVLAMALDALQKKSRVPDTVTDEESRLAGLAVLLYRHRSSDDPGVKMCLDYLKAIGTQVEKKVTAQANMDRHSKAANS